MYWYRLLVGCIAGQIADRPGRWRDEDRCPDHAAKGVACSSRILLQIARLLRCCDRLMRIRLLCGCDVRQLRQIFWNIDRFVAMICSG